jgi:hypothetical protein
VRLAAPDPKSPDGCELVDQVRIGPSQRLTGKELWHCLKVLLGLRRANWLAYFASGGCIAVSIVGHCSGGGARSAQYRMTRGQSEVTASISSIFWV